ncbi:hypothetical protein OKW41_002929 [Paraburkholderia sp. UCT70]|uniref:hypothetical protein n=1 Tax=Paraburkholderia sp. UCT70 TaxID=2991068 RepID=UPI003D1B3195
MKAVTSNASSQLSPMLVARSASLTSFITAAIFLTHSMPGGKQSASGTRCEKVTTQ